MKTQRTIKRKRCSVCRELKSDVYERPNSYARDIGNSPKATHTICDDCDEQNRLSI